MIRNLKTEFGLDIKSHNTILGRDYVSCGRRLKKSVNLEPIYYLAGRLQKTLKYLYKSFDYDYDKKKFTWILRDSADENTYGVATHPSVKTHKVLVLSFELNDTKLASSLTREDHFIEGLYHVTAERSMSYFSSRTAMRDAFTDAIIRHEIGHILTKNKDVKKMRSWLKIHSKKWWKTNISSYALKDAYEAISEVFAMVTDKNYEFGTLPRKMECMVLDMLSRD